MRLLAFNHSVAHSIHYFVSLAAIMEFSKFYFEALIEDKIKVILEDSPKNIHKGKDIIFGDRSLFHKAARVIYICMRAFYVSVIYYFLPFGIVLFQWFAPGG